MRWTEKDLEDFDRRMHKVRSVRVPVPPADMEPDSRHEPLAEKEASGLDTRCCIDVVSYRHRLCDSDGISAKALIDGLVHAGILPDDSPLYVKEVRYSQVKIPKTEMERTEVEIGHESRP